MENISRVTAFLAKKIEKAGGDPMRETLNMLITPEGHPYYVDRENDGFWRMYAFVDNATAYNSAEKEGLLYEVAKTFGIFQRQLSDYPAETLFDTIPYFHDTQKRYEAFEQAVSENLAGRAEEFGEEIAVLREFKERASIIVNGIAAGDIPTRVTHNDTKLNNILVDDATGKGLCVIDLDTVMPGSLLYDFGDSIRFAANNTAEDDPNYDNIWLRLDLYEEYVSGFLAGVGESITEREKELLPMSVFILTYELALRFGTDYLNGDTYFKINYPEHNLVRTRAQIRLMLDIDKKLNEMSLITKKYI